MTVSDAGLDGRHLRVAHDRVDKPGAAARDHHVDQAARLDQVGDGGTVLAGQQLHRVGRQVLGGQRRAQHLHQRGVGPRRRRAAAQQYRVARLQREAECVNGDVGPALVDDADHAERHSLLAQPQPVGERTPAQHLTDRVRELGDLAQPGRDAVDAVRAERQPIEQRVAGACRARGVQVLGVGGQNDVQVRKQPVGGSVQGPVLGGSGQRGKHSGGEPGAPGGIVDVLAQVGQRWCLQTHHPRVTAQPVGWELGARVGG